MDAQADLSLRWVHSHFVVFFFSRGSSYLLLYLPGHFAAERFGRSMKLVDIGTPFRPLLNLIVVSLNILKDDYQCTLHTEPIANIYFVFFLYIFYMFYMVYEKISGVLLQKLFLEDAD